MPDPGTSEPVIRRPPDTAPFRQYAKTDEQVRADGYQRGLEWPAVWNHVPGGPYAPDTPSREEHQDWIDYCHLLQRHRRLWLDGWHQGVKEAAKTNKDLRRMLNKLVYNKLSG